MLNYRLIEFWMRQWFNVVMQPESYEKKLYIMRDAEGEPNQEELEIIRNLEQELANNQCFVGIAPFGSKVAGYSTKESDLDLLIFIDDSERGVPDQEKRVDIVNEFIAQAETCVKQMRSTGKEVHVMYELANPEKILNELSSEMRQGSELLAAGVILAAMSRIVTGKKIDQYREIIASGLSKLTPEQKVQVHDTIVHSLVYGEGLRLLKRQKRMPELSEANHQKILDAREEMWDARVKKLWGI